MTLTISTIFRSPQKKLVKWLQDVGGENIKNSTYYERKRILLKVYYLPSDLRIENILDNILENISETMLLFLQQ